MNEQAMWMEKLACREVVERSVRHVDAGDADAFAALFAEDGALLRPGGAVLQGREAVRRSYAARPADRMTRHLVANTVVDIRADGLACACSYVLLWSGSADAPPEAFGRPAHARQIVGEFDDLLRRQADGAWRIQRREARFVLYAE